MEALEVSYMQKTRAPCPPYFTAKFKENALSNASSILIASEY
jgi:hypothetical protein